MNKIAASIFLLASVLGAQTATLQYGVNANSITALTFNGQNFYVPVSNMVQGGVFRSPSGVQTQIPWYSVASAIKTSGPGWFKHVYGKGPRYQFIVKTTFSQPDTRTLKADIDITNGDATDSLARLSLMLMPLKFPSTLTGRALNTPFVANQNDGYPVNFLTGLWGSAAVWQDYPSPANIRASFNQAWQTIFNFTIDTFTTRNFQNPTSKTGNKAYESLIQPGMTQHITYYVRFGGTTETVTTLAPEAFASYRVAFPDIVNWPDRRPIATWFISEGTKRSAKNPRGYLWNPSLNTSDTLTMQSAVMITTDQIIARMNAMTPRPQGIIVWDLEGQEFVHAFTYIGSPDKLPVMSPEMDGIANAMFARLRTAGYKVGVTIRPQDFGVGISTPSTCTPSASYNLADKFVRMGDAPPNRGFVCTAQNTWTVAHSTQPYEQVWTDDDATIMAALAKKIAYAQSRWGATLFYIDSDVWVKGDPLFANMFRALQLQFPNALLIPEASRSYHFGTSAPYVGSAAFHFYGTRQADKVIYPTAFSVVDVGSAQAAIVPQLAQSVKNGDILMFPAFWGAPEIPIVQQAYAAAKALP